ncbi:glyoxalase superfamily protein [Nioella nitratireducens]|uniref:glyoxalase superfamily protein n=1 Tax=Nioella nitratireducens TaxID=1287720 RepID=UPI0008FCE506|nr:glyoxalase superfamily protein [Nioella nitratireducens]
MTRSLPTLAEAKAQAKRLRVKLAEDGTEIGHARSLELVAHQLGFRDWNTLHAAIGNRPPEGFAVGGRIEGRYLGQPFAATVVGVESLSPGWFRLELDLDEAVDVVTFDSFSNFRKRIRGVVGPSGLSKERTSGGQPHLELEI